jgi:Cft2 family RNA processing exonuclease
MFDHRVFRSTYATTVRDSKRARERDFLKAVHTCVAAGGKVLIPVFALGRAQVWLTRPTCMSSCSATASALL